MGFGRIFPTGTVTLLFSDIEGSTQLWEQWRDAFRPILDRHNSVIRELIEIHHGYEVKTEGDAFMISFETASQGLKFAVAAQLMLAEQDWTPLPLPLRVRMGLHSGDVITVTHPDGNQDYFGPAVNRAARVASSAHGGQIVISRVTRELIGPIATELTLKDLGTHQLKGLDAPEQIYQVCHPEMGRQEFPPLKTLNTVRHNLPTPVTTFIGRNREVKELTEMLLNPSNRLVTLLGPGGAGKTRLSQYVAAEIADQFSDGVWLAELADYEDEPQVWNRLLHSLGLHSHPLKEAKDVVRPFVAEKQILLVLDNTEQISEIGEVVSQLLSAGTGVKCLVTTRNWLKVRGEKVYSIPMMPVPTDRKLSSVLSNDATRLFLERARDVSQDFELSEKNAQYIVELVQRLDGLPLAIELVAARIRGASVKHLLDRIKQIVLSVDQKGVQNRQQNLKNTIDWSFRLLDDDMRMLLLHLSTFVGGFTLDAARALCGEACGGDAFDLEEAVQELNDRSLLTSRRVGEDMRYGMLETIRSFCLEKLSERFDETYVATLKRQHADYFLEFAERLNDLLVTDDVAWLQLESELPNIRVAMDTMLGGAIYDMAARLALSMCPLLGRRGYWSERKSCAETGLRVAKMAYGQSHAVVAGLLHQMAKSHHERCEYEVARSYYQLCMAMRIALGDRQGEALVLNNLALISNRQGNRAAARAMSLQSLELMRMIDDKYGLGLVHNTLGSIAAEEGNQVEAEHNYEQSLSFRRDIQDQQGIAGSLNNLATTAERRGDTVRADRLYTESLDQNRRLGDRCAIASCLHNLARMAKGRNEIAVAIRLASESLDIRRELGDRSGIAMSYSLLSNLAYEQENFADAKRLAESAIEVWQEIGSETVIHGQMNLAEILHRMKQYTLAVQTYQRVIADANSHGKHRIHGEALMGWARSALAEGRIADATLQLRRARRLFWRQHDLKNLAEAVYELGKVYETCADWQRSGWYLDVAARLSPDGACRVKPARGDRFADFASRHKVICSSWLQRRAPIADVSA